MKTQTPAATGERIDEPSTSQHKHGKHQGGCKHKGQHKHSKQSDPQEA